MTDKTVACEILKQLGGRRFIAMTGASNMGCDNNSMSMKIMRNSAKVTHVKIELTVMDVYKMTFYNCSRDLKVIAERENVYNDMLQDVFTSITGLNTSL
jgi:hypothetical protein